MPRLKIMKNYENENKLLNKKSNKKSKKSKAPKKKKTTYYAEDGIFYCGRKNVAATNNEELNPDEYLNNVLKMYIHTGFPPKTKEQIKTKMEKYISYITPEQIKKLFLHPKLSY